MLLDLMGVLVDTHPDHLGNDHGSNGRFGLLVVACLHTCSSLVASGILDSSRVIVVVSLIFLSHCRARSRPSAWTDSEFPFIHMLLCSNSIEFLTFFFSYDLGIFRALSPKNAVGTCLFFSSEASEKSGLCVAISTTALAKSALEAAISHILYTRQIRSNCGKCLLYKSREHRVVGIEKNICWWMQGIERVRVGVESLAKPLVQPQKRSNIICLC
jgi:hypothetical protein